MEPNSSSEESEEKGDLDVGLYEGIVFDEDEDEDEDVDAPSLFWRRGRVSAFLS